MDSAGPEHPTIAQFVSSTRAGPFRWFLYESLRDGKPDSDQMVTELDLMRGSASEGGSAWICDGRRERLTDGAAKGHIVASPAFLGIELQWRSLP